MLKDLHVIHRRKPHSVPARPQDLVWETCLRSIAIHIHPHSDQDVGGHEVYSHHHAYRFLLEVICGLHSPVVGETEVFGQFKDFTKRWLASDPGKAALVQRLFAEAKEIRSKYLSNLGVQSYGGWLKRKVQARKIHILGGGNLAREVAPYMLKQAESVTVHVRNPARVSIQGATVRELGERAFDAGGLIVAAPMSAGDIQRWMKGSPEEIFDLRDSSSSDRLKFGGVVHHVLEDVFEEINRTKAVLRPLIERVKNEISARSERTADHVHVRPQGWDDICA